MFDFENPHLKRLAESEGFDDPYDLVEAYHTDSVCPSICTEPGCGYTTDMEPDQTHGWCENCGTNTVVSALVLAGLI